MRMSEQKRRLVSTLPNGQLRVEIDRVVKQADGSTRRIRLRRALPRSTSANEAETIARRMEHELIVKGSALKGAEDWPQYVAGLSAEPKSWLYVTIKNIQQRSKRRGLTCSLTIGQLREIMLRSRGRCELTGLRFSAENDTGARCRPYFHSLDRIDASKGYTLDNVRVVCHAVNIAMNAWGEETFAELARGFVFNRYSAFNVGSN